MISVDQCSHISLQASTSFAESLYKMFDVESHSHFGNSQAIVNAFRKVKLFHIFINILKKRCMIRSILCINSFRHGYGRY